MINIDTCSSSLDNPNSTILFDNSNKVVKVCKNRDKESPLDNAWITTYNDLAKNNEAFVKVFNTNGFDTFEMEKLNVLTTVRELFASVYNNPHQDIITKGLICDIIHAMQSTWIDMITYSKNLSDKMFFIHSDLALHNIVVTTDLKVKIIDPDSINLYNFENSTKFMRTYYLGQLDLMLKLQDVSYHNILQDAESKVKDAELKQKNAMKIRRALKL